MSDSLLSPLPLPGTRQTFRLLALVALTACTATTALAQEALRQVRGQSLYLPIYSHFWHGNLGNDGKASELPLSALVSIRNTDTRTPIKVTSARYFDTGGKLLRNFVSQTQTVPPMGTLELFIERRESEGGSGANFLIRWESEALVNPPLVEAVHADLYGTRAISFVTRGQPIQE